MGQYYKCLTKEGGEFKTYSLQVKGWKEKDDGKYGYYNGVKLMEHSWWGNSFMKAITTKLYHHKMRVAWVGDYADDFHWEDEEKVSPKTLHWLAWGGFKDTPTLPDEDIYEGNMTLDHKYLVNHTREIYLDCDEYKKKSQDKDGWCVHPLSLLTACGNGLGGGDYWEEHPYSDCVGDWCFDEISVEDTPPKNYTKEYYEFREN